MIIILNSIVEVLKKIENAGFKAYVVGGFVRDFYLNKENPDVDICTSAKPSDLRNIFGDNISLDQYGSLILTENEQKYEITTFRRESKYLDNRHPTKVKFVKSLKTDLKRRDFTMNAICLTSDLNYIDIFKGREDINNHLIRMIGKPEKRLKEDTLRILRAVRFATTLDFELEENLKNAIMQNGHLVNNLSYFYKKKELEKIFLSPNIKKGISLILDLGLASALELKNLEKIVLTSSLIGIWTQLDVADIYPFQASEIYIMKAIKKLEEKDLFDVHILYNNQLVVLKLAAEIRQIDPKIIEEKYNKLPIHNKNDIEVNYKDIENMLNDKNSDKINDIIRDIEHLILSGKIENKKDILTNYILKRYN